MDEAGQLCREMIRQRRIVLQGTKAARKRPKGTKGPCQICGGWAGLTQAHHLCPLGIQRERGWQETNHATVWLCPNHHALLHARARGDVAAKAIWNEEPVVWQRSMTELLLSVWATGLAENERRKMPEGSLVTES